jgi:hypothetical protein
MLRRSAQNVDAYNKAASALKAEPVGHVTTVRGAAGRAKGARRNQGEHPWRRSESPNHLDHRLSLEATPGIEPG